MNKLDTEILLAHVLNVSRTYLHTHPDLSLNTEQQKQFDALIAQREQGMPIAYLIGHREFWSLDLLVTPDVLIPRPETELLVESVLNQLPKNEALTIAELGTGSGAISLALAKERPQWKIIAADISANALAIAQKNAAKLLLKNIEFCESDWFTALPKQTYTAIISNPPYIAENDAHLKQGDLRFEPLSALASGKEGLDAIQTIIKNAGHYLAKKGWLFLEHGYDQKIAVQNLLHQQQYQHILTHHDLAHHPRVTQGQWL